MYAVATFLIVAVIAMAFGQMSTGALIATGVPPDIAAFQARSAFSGAGFTTTEAENVVNHPTRRRVIATTMFVGSLGTPTLVVTVLLGLVAPGPGSTTERTLVTVWGSIAILLMITNKPMRRVLVGVGQRYTQNRLVPALGHDADELFTIGHGYVISSVLVASDPDHASRSLRGLQSAIPGVRVLGVKRNSEYFGEPPVDIDLQEGDRLVIYSHRDRLDFLGHDEPPDPAD